MNCQEFWNTIPEPGRPHPHLENCAECRVRMTRHQELQAGFRALASADRHIQAPSRVESRLLSKYRAQMGVAPAGRRRWIPALTWAAAFAAMLALGLFLIRDRRPEVVRSPVPAAVERASLETPDFDGFIPLPNADALPAGEEVDFVHVEVPRSAMLAVGLQVSPDRAAEMVEADVMLGADGVARAVRFLD